MNEQYAARDPEQRNELMHEAEKIAIDEDAWIPIYYYVSKALVSTKLEGLRRQHQAHPSLALDVGSKGSPAVGRHIGRRLIDRPADAVHHRHAELLHDAGWHPAGRSTRSGRSRPTSCATSSGPITSTSRCWQQYLRYLGGVVRGDLRPVLPHQGLHRRTSCWRRARRPASRSAAWRSCWPPCWALRPASRRRSTRTALSTMR